jgi:transglutaminase-like putative cysteine protease
MLYTIRHHTRFTYSAPIAESVTEVRMHPRTSNYQQCSTFRLQVRPHAHIIDYTDHLNNTVHHFTQPGLHQSLSIVAESEVQVNSRPVPPEALSMLAWEQIDASLADGENWEMLSPSSFTERTERLDGLAHALDVTRRRDPLSLLYELNSALHRTFAYDAKSTHVDSPIDEALQHRRGVCQDFAHIMLALTRNYLSIPSRYVSGYLYHRRDDRSADGATHAWVEVWLPGLEWVGFDPTNNLLAGERHIEVAVGRDYRDVPPTRGVYKGNANSELAVTVRVRASQDPEHDVSADLETIEAPVYRSTEQALQERYAQALLAMQIQQQQQQQQQQ